MDFDPEAFRKLIQPRPIPEILYSDFAEAPFSLCNSCGEDLRDGRLYEIQKVYRGPEPIFEFAVCHRCGETLSKEFSAESTENVKTYLMEQFKPTVEANHCHFCGFPRSLIQNFTVVGACAERSIVLPLIIMCDGCSERLQTLLSQKTRDVQGDFIRDNFPGIPADFDLSPSFNGILS